MEVAFDTIEYIHIFSVFQTTLGLHFRVSDCKYTKKSAFVKPPCARVCVIGYLIGQILPSLHLYYMYFVKIFRMLHCLL
jgi:hypothetical protein